MNILYILLALGIVGHAINMYCDRILSIFPNGTLKLVNYSKLKEGDYAAKLMEGVSPSVPLRSGVLGVFANSKSGFTVVHKRSEKFTGCRRRCQGKAQGLCRALSSGSGGSSVVHRCRSGFA